ncbi:MAG TPA: hypothetical protein VG318_09425 [Actinomycetota bacterium]|nr:hypothetical protein [Actinomycetota bacterium]
MGDEREDLDPYRPTPPADARTIGRWVARAVGILVGLAILLYGVALYALRCFDTCPSDPAQDHVYQLLTGAIILFGIVVLVAASFAGTRRARAGLSVVTGLGAAVVACGLVAVAFVPAIDAPGDHSGSTQFGMLAVLAGGVSAGTAWAFRRRSS